MLSEKKKRKRKTCSKKWYLKRNISCDVHLLNELLETDVPWDDAIVVSAGKLGKVWDYMSELRSSLCERRLDRTVLRPALLPVKTVQFTQFFRQVWRHTVKSLSLTESVFLPQGKPSSSWIVVAFWPRSKPIKTGIQGRVFTGWDIFFQRLHVVEGLWNSVLIALGQCRSCSTVRNGIAQWLHG